MTMYASPTGSSTAVSTSCTATPHTTRIPSRLYRHKLVLYGCGDFIDDYEGIPGYEEFRDDLVLMYLAAVESATGCLVSLRMVPLRIRKMRLERAAPAEAEWLRDRLTRICSRFGSRVEMTADRRLWLRWPASQSRRL